MAATGTTQWDVRTTGNDGNGGGFDTSSAGSDFSQQDSPQITYTDLVIDGSDNLKITSSGNPFTSAHVGNIINITSGTGFTVQRVQILSVASGVATCDVVVGTVSSTGGNGKLGGALATPDPAVAKIAGNSGSSGSTIHIKTGTYTRTTTLNLASSTEINFVGYGASHRDGGTKPLITTSTNSTPLFFVGGGNQRRFENLSFSNTASTRSYGFKSNAGGSYNYVVLENCILDGFSWGAIADNNLSSAGYVKLIATEIKNCTLGGASAWFGLVSINSFIHDNSGPGLQKTSNQNDAQFDVFESTIYANTKGIDLQAGSIHLNVFNSALVSNTSDAISISSSANEPYICMHNSIVYGNTGYGIDLPGVAAAVLIHSFRNNALGSNSTANYKNYSADASDITLTADPFTSKSTGDFTLNSTAGGGALLKALSFPTTFPGGAANARDIGPLQTAASGGSGASNHGFIG